MKGLRERTPRVLRPVVAAALVASAATLAAVAVLLVIVRDAPPGSGSDPGRAAAEQFARDYVDSLNDGDPARLSALLGEPFAAPDVADRIDRYGGRGLRTDRLSVASEFPRIYTVTIEARGADGTAVKIYEVIEWQGDRWHMAPPVAPTTTARSGG